MLAGVAILGLFLPEDPVGFLDWVRRLSIALLLLFPYFLYRFTAAFDPPSRSLEVATLIVTLAVFLAALVVPLPGEGEPRSEAARALILAVLVEWSFLSIVAAFRMWRAGREEPTPGRRRLRLLSVASLALTITIILAGTAPADEADGTGVLVQASALASVLLFFVALFPPRVLQRAWRGPEEAEFRQAISELMMATRTEDVFARLLPHIRIVGGREAVIVDESGKVIAGSQATADTLEAGGEEGPNADRGGLPSDMVPLPLRGATLLVRASPYSLFLGRSELELMETLAALADLALERVEAEETVRDQAEMLDLAPDAILVRDLDGRIIYWNRGAAELYGYSKEEALGKISYELLGTRFPRAREEIEARLLETGRWEGELIQSRKDGSQITVATRWSVRAADDGRRAHVLAINTDITEQKAAAREVQLAKEEAERANQAKSEFLSRMSHELRTPLNAILGFGQLLEMSDLDGEGRDSVAEIIKAGKHLLELINEVLEISRIEAGKLAISLEAVPVHDLVAESLSLIRPIAEQRGLTLSYDATGCEGKHVLGDFQRLKQVLLNLLSNAVKYNEEGGSVHLSCGPGPAKTLRIGVTDTGRGIPEESLGRLFEPFERLGAEDTGEEGAGLGLALSKRLVEAMGGSIGVRSERRKGSTFWIDLRRAEDPVARLDAKDEEAGEIDSSPRPSRTALYIEDNLSNLKLIQRVLARRPEIRLIAAMQGRSGLDLAREHSPDIILLDLQLPDMAGKDVLRELKAHKATWDIPVVVISADATQSQIRDLLAAGAKAYLTKPLDVQEFLEVLDQ